jgi:predicted DNA-binding transcriptional regulator AlpA
LTEPRTILDTGEEMANFSTREVARKLGISHSTLANYIKIGKIPAPQSITSGGTTVHIWSEKDIDRLRELLPKIANGRKTRYQKLRKQKPSKKRKPNKN